MKNILSILKTVSLVVGLFLLTATSLANAYVIFAPDEWPKPFYMVYRYPVIPNVTEGGETSHETTGHTSEAPGASVSEANHGEGAGGETGGKMPVAPGAATMEIRPGQGIMIDTGTKIVNLVDPTGRKYLRSTIVLEFAPTDLRYYTMEAEEKTLFLEEFNAEMNAKVPVVNDILISMLASQSFESVYTAEGKETLRKSIMDTINTQLPEVRVIYVYFTEFVVQ